MLSRGPISSHRRQESKLSHLNKTAVKCTADTVFDVKFNCLLCVRGSFIVFFKRERELQKRKHELQCEREVVVRNNKEATFCLFFLCSVTKVIKIDMSQRRRNCKLHETS